MAQLDLLNELAVEPVSLARYFHGRGLIVEARKAFSDAHSSIAGNIEVYSEAAAEIAWLGVQDERASGAFLNSTGSWDCESGGGKSHDEGGDGSFHVAGCRSLESEKILC